MINFRILIPISILILIRQKNILNLVFRACFQRHSRVCPFSVKSLLFSNESNDTLEDVKTFRIDLAEWSICALKSVTVSIVCAK